MSDHALSAAPPLASLRPATGAGPCVASTDVNEQDAGGSLAELLVAGLLSVLLLGIVTNIVAGPVRAVHGLLEGGRVVTELTHAGAILGSLAADARAGLRESAVLVAEPHLVLVRHEREAVGDLRALILADGELRSVQDQQLLAAALLDPSRLRDAAGPVIVGVANQDSMFVYLDAEGTVVSGDDPARIRHVVLTLESTHQEPGGRGTVTRHAVHVVEIGAQHPVEIRR